MNQFISRRRKVRRAALPVLLISLAAPVFCARGERPRPEPVFRIDFDGPSGAIWLGGHAGLHFRSYAELQRPLPFDPANLQTVEGRRGFVFQPPARNHLPSGMDRPAAPLTELLRLHDATTAIVATDTPEVVGGAALRVAFGAGGAVLELPGVPVVERQGPFEQCVSFVFSAHVRGREGAGRLRLAIKAHAPDPGESDATLGEADVVVDVPDGKWRRVWAVVETPREDGKREVERRIDVVLSNPGMEAWEFDLAGLQLERCRNYPLFHAGPTGWIPGGTQRAALAPSLRVDDLPMPFKSGTIAFRVRLEAQFPPERPERLTWVNIGRGTQPGEMICDLSDTSFEIHGNRIRFPSLIPRLLDGGFLHLALTWDRDQAVAYLDGEILGRAAMESPPLSDGWRGEERVHFGHSPSPRLRYTQGLLTDVAVFDQALDAAEVAALANPAGSARLDNPLRVLFPPPSETVYAATESAPHFDLILHGPAAGPSAAVQIEVSGIGNAQWHFVEREANTAVVRVAFSPVSIETGTHACVVDVSAAGVTRTVCFPVSVIPGPLQPGAWQPPPPGEHPRILFGAKDLPEMRARIETPRGRRFLRNLSQHAFLDHPPARDYFSMLEAGQETSPLPDSATQAGHLGRVMNAAFLHVLTGNEDAGDIVRRAALLQARHGEQRDSHCLQPMALIYDWCHSLFSEDERGELRRYMAVLAAHTLETLQTSFWAFAPSAYDMPAYYWATLVGSRLGLAALALEGTPEYRAEWLEAGTKAIDLVLQGVFGDGGSFESGVGYLSFCFSNTMYFWEAMRLRGMRWDRHPRISEVPSWVAFRMLPGTLSDPARIVPVGPSSDGQTLGNPRVYMWFHHLYPDNPLAAWNYRAVAGPDLYGASWDGVDNISWILWDNVPRQLTSPDRLLPRTRWFPEWGIFFRSGWQPDDFVFWIGSRESRSILADHSDKGSFYLHAFGQVFADDIAEGNRGDSILHSLVKIDGEGQGWGWRTAGRRAPVSAFLDGGGVSGAVVDQAEAYSWHYKRHPETEDYSRIHREAFNPVRKARRAFLVNWESSEGVPPYVVVADDIDKDGETRTYQWRMLLPDDAVADERENQAVVYRPAALARLAQGPASPMTWNHSDAFLEVHLIHPAGLTPDVKRFSRHGARTRQLCVELNTVNPYFAVLLYPRTPGMPEAKMTHDRAEHLHGVRIQWDASVEDLLVFARQDGPVPESETLFEIHTDARIARIRLRDGKPVAAALIDGSVLRHRGVTLPLVVDEDNRSAEWIDAIKRDTRTLVSP